MFFFLLNIFDPWVGQKADGVAADMEGQLYLKPTKRRHTIILRLTSVTPFYGNMVKLFGVWLGADQLLWLRL